MNDQRTAEMKTWEKPELIILVRNQPEEAVLTACKGVTVPGGPGVSAISCGYTPCGSCTWVVLSWPIPQPLDSLALGNP